MMSDDDGVEQARCAAAPARLHPRTGFLGSADSGLRSQTRMTFKEEDFVVQVQVSADGGDAPRLHVTVERASDGAAWHASFTSSCALPAAQRRARARACAQRRRLSARPARRAQTWRR